MAGLLEADVEAVAQAVHVVPQFTRRFEKGAIGQQQRPCRIVGEADPAHVARGGKVEGGPVQFVLDQILEP
ncbi:hypothetical protein D3C73_1459050 [compost metagenome]